MKSVSLQEAQSDLRGVVDSSQEERVVITCEGKPTAIIVGLSSYDEEDLELMRSSEFWNLIQHRRRQGKSIPLLELKRRIAENKRAGSPKKPER